MKIIVMLVWLTGLALFLATGAYLATNGHPYLSLLPFGLIFFYRFKVEAD